MAVYSVTQGMNATTNYDNFAFDSFCKGPDGRYYAIKADGLYVLGGDNDAGAEIAASVDFGELGFGTTKLKRASNVYLAVSSDEPMIVGVNGYEYPTRRSSVEMQEQRADIGKGIRATFLSITVRNQTGSDFEIESAEIRALPTTRRI